VSSVERFRSMGCEIAVCTGDGDTRALERIRRLFEERDARFSRFARAGAAAGELTRVNRSRCPVLVSPELARALRAALDAARATDGLVDPTLLNALEGAGYDADFASLAPDPRPPRRARPGRVAEVRLTGRLLERPPDVRLDLNGVVKSMAVDDALALTGGGWISAGGDLAAARPIDVALPAGGAVRLEAGALATSGSAQRRWVRGGRVQHHLIDPRTGLPADSPWQAVTVCGATCRAADVAAKAAFLLGTDGPDWLDERGMAGRFVAAVGAVVVLNRSWQGAVPACT
jgi:thiamine biosynthesis lipoprotein